MIDRTGKRVGHVREREVGDGRRRIRRGKMGKRIYIHGQHVTEFLTNCCMFAYECHRMTMCT